LKEERGDPWFRPIPSLKMKDGASMSVQASSYHYCSPRKDMPIEGWSSFEVWCCEGLTVEELHKIQEHGGEGCDMSEGPAGWVPHDVLWEIIQNHGGIQP